MTEVHRILKELYIGMAACMIIFLAAGAFFARPYYMLSLIHISKRTIIRAFADTGAVKEEGTERVTLYRDDKHLYINGVRFPMRRLQRGEEQQLWLGNLSVTDRLTMCGAGLKSDH